MELNREQIGKISEIIFDKVGAFGMYSISPAQSYMILGIINELTEENERLRALRTVDSDYKFCNLLYNALVFTKTLEDYNAFKRKMRADSALPYIQGRHCCKFMFYDA